MLTSASPSLGSTSANVAKTISLTTFIGTATGNTVITDPNPNAVVGGIAIVGITGKGTWAYSLNGTTFTDVGTVSTSSALLLPSTATLRYTPDGTDTETATIEYCAWDTTSGTAGGTANTTTDGGSTAFSTATDTASLAVTAARQAPVLTPASPTLGSVAANGSKTISLTGTFINNGTATTTITDATSGAVVGGIAVTLTTGKGTWAYSLDGTTFTNVGTVSSTSALLLPNNAELRYTPDGTDTETATITYCAWDTTTGSSGTYADTTSNGGSTAFSTATDTASLTVTAAHDAPVLTAASPSLGSIAANGTKTISLTKSFINNGSGTTTITDATTGAVVGGIAVTGTTGKGTWAYSLDGTNFTDIGTVADDSALLLPATATLRYTPDGTDTETATITYCAWDTTTGTAGGTADTTSHGGATAFSTATDTASLTVTAATEGPVLTAAKPSLGTTTANTAKTISLTTFINNGTGTTTITDSASGAVIGGIAVTGTTGLGTWAYSLDGTTFTDIGTVANDSALLLPKSASLRYTPDGTDTETPTITYRAWDTTSGTAGDKVRHDHQRRRYGLQRRHRHRLAHGNRGPHGISFRVRLYREREGWPIY